MPTGVLGSMNVGSVPSVVSLGLANRFCMKYCGRRIVCGIDVRASSTSPAWCQRPMVSGVSAAVSKADSFTTYSQSAAA